MKFNDSVLIRLYVKHDVPCDRLVSNPSTLHRFSAEYSALSGHIVEVSELSHHLLNLRRKGEKNGGLPRLRRKYNGRKSI